MYIFCQKAMTIQHYKLEAIELIIIIIMIFSLLMLLNREISCYLNFVK